VLPDRNPRRTVVPRVKDQGVFIDRAKWLVSRRQEKGLRGQDPEWTGHPKHIT